MEFKPGDKVLIPATDEMLDASGNEAYLVPATVTGNENCSPGAVNCQDDRGLDYARWDNIPTAHLRRQG